MRKSDDQQMKKGSDVSEWYRRRGKVRKDGPSRTHERKVPQPVGNGPHEEVLERAGEARAKVSLLRLVSRELLKY